MIRQKLALMLWGLCLISPLSMAWTPAAILDNETDCKVESLQNMWLCGQFSGRLNTLYYSTHDAYFVQDLNQDTASTGGFIKYTVAPLQGVQAGVDPGLLVRLKCEAPCVVGFDGFQGDGAQHVSATQPSRA